MRLSLLFLSFFILFLSSCATVTGPSVSQQELDSLKENLKVKALSFRIKHLQKLENILTRLVLGLPEDIIKRKKGASKPFLGIVVVDIDRYLHRLYNLEENKGVVIIAVLENSPAQRAGIKEGDVLLSLNDKGISNFRDYYHISNKLNNDQILRIKISRGKKIINFSFKTESIPFNIPVVMVPREDVNAATDGRAIYVTYGLMNFIHSEDEIAAVLAHELAHIVRGHTLKMQGGRLLTNILALVLGMVVEKNSGGSGNSVLRGLNYLGDVFAASYSRDLEREADYFAIKFLKNSGFNPEGFVEVLERFAVQIPASMVKNYFSTHPTSVERILRVKKAILKEQEVD